MRRARAAAIRRRELLRVLALAAASGCVRRRGHDARSTLTIAYPGDEWVLGPSEDLQAKLLVFLPLAGRNARGELEGRLAESWEHSADQRSWTIRLRRGVLWHDGVPVTAHDVKFTLELLSRVPPDVSPHIEPGSMDVQLLDDYTYRLTLHRRAPGSPADDWTVFYPKHLLEHLDPAEFARWEFWLRPVGNGPYRYVGHVAKTMTELTAFDRYYRGRPRIERIVLKFGPRTLPELLSGNVDALAYVNPMDLLKIARDPRFRTYYFANGFDHHVILWNHRHAALRDAAVRRALTMAIDRRALLRVLNLPEELPVADALFTQAQFQRRDLPAPLPFDPVEAGRLLDAAGWRRRESDGMRARHGRPLSIVAGTPPSAAAGAASLERASTIVQSELARIGVEMQTRVLELHVGRELLRGNRIDAWFGRMTVAAHRLTFGAQSILGYRNDTVHAALESVAREVNEPARDAAYKEVAPLVQQDAPVTYLHPDVWTTVVHRRVRGWSESRLAEPYWYMENVSVEGA